MGRFRTRQSILLLCIVVVVFAAIVPTIASSVGTATLTLLTFLVPPTAVAVIRRRALRCDDQPASLLSIVLSRAPPAFA
jgi:hypothetical protein